MRWQAFLWDVLGCTFQYCMRCDSLNPHVGTGTSNLNVQVVFVSSLFMAFISRPCCFGVPLGDVTL